MLPDNAFLRTIPNITDSTDALHVDSIVFSSDTISASIGAIRHAALYFKEKIPDAGRPVTIGMFTHAWTIVDCVHVIRQNIKALRYETPLSAQYLEKFEAATLLRNKMDHLAENAKNTARAKKKRPPIFGSLSYICVPDDKLVQKDGNVHVLGGGMVILTTGRMADMRQVTAVNPAGLKLNGQVGGFRLDAFDQQLELEIAAEDTKALAIEMDKNLKQRVHEFAEEKARALNVPKTDLLKHSGAGLSLYLAFEAKDA